MTELWVREQLADLAAEPAPPAPSYAGLIDAGNRRRRRRRAKLVGLAAAAAVVAAGVPTAIIRAEHPSAPAQLKVAASPSAVAEHVTAGENSPYWFEQYDEIYYSAGADGKPVKRDQLDDLWLGHSRASVGAMGSGPNYPKPEKYPEFGKGGFAAGTHHAWEEQWNSATDPATVKAYLVADVPAIGGVKVPLSAATTDKFLFQAGYGALEFPGTTDFRRAIIGVMEQLPEVTVSTGTDDAGRAATLLTFAEGESAEGESNVTTVSYVDLPSATLLETDQRFAPLPEAPSVGSTASPTTLTRYVNLWRTSGPADTAPTGATTAEQMAAAVSIPANPDPSHPTCTPGKRVDASPLAAQMAAICLPDPAPGFPKRRGLDYAGSKDDRSFYLAQTKATATIQIQPHNNFSLTGAKSITPDSNGMAGTCKAGGSTTVLGVPATECVPDPGQPGDAGQNGLIFSIDGLAVEVFADNNTPFAQLIALANSLKIGPPPAG